MFLQRTVLMPEKRLAVSVEADRVEVLAVVGAREEQHEGRGEEDVEDELDRGCPTWKLPSHSAAGKA
jgi:hypothetical protein